MFESFYAAYGKNVSENCARIISTKSDQELQPYFMELLRWLEDRKWPGTELVFNRLLDVQELGLLPFAMNECTKEAYVMEEHIWLYNMAELLANKKLAESLSARTVELLQEAKELED